MKRIILASGPGDKTTAIRMNNDPGYLGLIVTKYEHVAVFDDKYDADFFEWHYNHQEQIRDRHKANKLAKEKETTMPSKATMKKLARKGTNPYAICSAALGKGAAGTKGAKKERCVHKVAAKALKKK